MNIPTKKLEELYAPLDMEAQTAVLKILSLVAGEIDNMDLTEIDNSIWEVQERAIDVITETQNALLNIAEEQETA